MSTQVGEATIKLTFDGKSLNASLSGVEKQVESGGKNTGSKWGSAWSVAAGNMISAGVGKVANAISSNMDRAIERLDTVKNAQHVFEALGYNANSVSKSMSTLDDYLDGLPTSLTQAVQGVQTLSASFGGIERGTEAFIDLNNAGLAFGATSENIEGAIIQLSQMDLNGPLDAATWNSLQQRGFQPVFAAMAKEAGITVGELKESFGKKGDKTVKDFLDTLHRLGTEGGGGMKSFAELARENTNGVGTALENVQNRIGKAIEKILEHIGQERIADAINKISYAFADVADVVIKIIDFLSANRWILEFLLPFVGSLVTGLTALNAVLTIQRAILAASPVTWIIVAIAAIIGLLVVLVKNWDKITKAVGIAFEAIKGFFKGIGEALKEAFDKVGLFFTNLKTRFYRFLAEIYQKLMGIGQWIWDNVLSPIVEFLKNIGIVIVAILATILQFIWETFFAPIINFYIQVGQFIFDHITAFFEKIKAVVLTIVEWVNVNVVQPIASFFTSLWEGIVNKVTSAVERIKAVWEGIKNWINSNIVQPIAGFFKGLWDGVKKGAEALGGGITKAMSTIGGAIKAPINAIIKAINGVIDEINKLTVPDWVPGIGGQHANFGHIPELAQGGLVSGATNAIIGERGAEAVIPLERNTENWTRPLATALAEEFREQGKGQNITINVNNPTVRDDDDIRKITQGISQMIRRTA